MPVELIPESDIKTSRISKIQRTTEWNEIITHLVDLPNGKALKITLSDDTLNQLKKPKQTLDDARKTTLVSFTQKLRNAYAKQFRVRSLQGAIVIQHLVQKDKRK